MNSIIIKNQNDFNNIQISICKLIELGEKNINVLFYPGVYEYKEKHILLNELIDSDLIIKLRGSGKVSLIPCGENYCNGEFYQGKYSSNNSWMDGDKNIDVWSQIIYSDSLVEVLDYEKKTCRIKCNKHFSDKLDIKDSYILIPHWYKSSVYKVTCVDGGYIYFNATDLNKSDNGKFNVNDDYNYGNQPLRFKLCNVENDEYNIVRINNGRVILPKGIKTIREGRTNNFISIENCVFNSVEIEGLDFYGNSNANYSPLFSINGVLSNKIRINNCTFNGIRSEVISVQSSSNVEIDNNSFNQCYYYGIISDNESCNTSVHDNSFSLMGLRMMNSFCILCCGEKFSIKNNIIKDFGYGGIAVGMWYGNEQKQPCSGIIENNEIANTASYNASIANYGIMDGGAIYLYTKIDGMIIRDNYIHDISGAGDNRGIFCDDGARNITIVGNVITGIDNSYCIDSRRVGHIEKDIGPTNTGIVITGNVVDGLIRFEGRESDDNGCLFGTNYYLQKESDSSITNDIKNVSITGDIQHLKHLGYKKDKICISKESYNLLKKDPEWKQIKKYFRKKIW